MSDWTKIISFTYPHEAHLAKTKLESEGIEVQIRDELTAQVNNFYSGAIGGVKLFVQQSDFETAYKILVESGYIKAEEPPVNKVLAWIEKFTARFPFIGKSILEIRLIALITIVLLLLVIPVVLLSIPTNFEKLTENRWCIERMLYNGKEVVPKTTGFVISFGHCSETMSFSSDGEATFPGLNSREQELRWEKRRDRVIIEYASTSKKNNNKYYSIYPGIYELKITGNQIILQSDSLTITGSALNSGFRF